MKTMMKTGLMVAVILAFACLSCAKQDEPPKSKEKAQSEQAATPNAEETGTVLAIVGDEKITEESVYAPLAMMPPQFRSRYETPEGKKKLLERSVQMSLLSQEARRLKIDEKEEIARRVKEMSDQLIVQELTKQEVLDKIKVTEEQMQQHYEQNKDSFKKEEKVRVNMILFTVEDSATPEVKDQKKAQAEKALERIKKGEDFEAVAKEVSEDERTKNRGGNIGMFARGKRTEMHGEEFEAKAFSLPLNEVSDVFQGKKGFYIIKVMDKKPMEEESFESAKPRIERTLKTEKQKESMENYLEELKKKYPVKMLEANGK